MNENLCLRLEQVGALIRSRIVEWRGYRGQGRTEAFVSRVIKLGLFLARVHRRNERDFPVSRMALEPLVGMGDHAIRTALKCLREIGLLEMTSLPSRQGKTAREGALAVWWKAAQFRLSQAVRSLMVEDTKPEPAQAENQTRQDETLNVRGKDMREGKISPTSDFLAGCPSEPEAETFDPRADRPKITPQARSEANAFLRAIRKPSQPAQDGQTQAEGYLGGLKLSSAALGALGRRLW